MSRERDIERGTQARHIMESALFQEAIAKVQQKIFDDFARCDPKDKDALQVNRLELKALADVIRHVNSVMKSGQFAEAEVAEEQKRKARLSDRLKAGLRSVF